MATGYESLAGKLYTFAYSDSIPTSVMKDL